MVITESGVSGFSTNVSWGCCQADASCPVKTSIRAFCWNIWSQRAFISSLLVNNSLWNWLRLGCQLQSASLRQVRDGLCSDRLFWYYVFSIRNLRLQGFFHFTGNVFCTFNKVLSHFGNVMKFTHEIYYVVIIIQWLLRIQLHLIWHYLTNLFVYRLKTLGLLIKSNSAQTIQNFYFLTPRPLIFSS